MSKLAVELEIPEKWEQFKVRDVVRKIQDAINDLAEGRIRARYLTSSTTPAFGTFSTGDWVFNSAPTELGTAGGKYVLLGWVCTSGGSPGSFNQIRTLTGN